MKVIVDIPEELYKAYKGKSPMLGDAGMDMITQSIANGIQLPDNATNGDIIDVIFQSVDFFQDGAWMQISFDNMTYSFCPVKWWNAPYKGSED